MSSAVVSITMRLLSGVCSVQSFEYFTTLTKALSRRRTLLQDRETSVFGDPPSVRRRKVKSDPGIAVKPHFPFKSGDCGDAAESASLSCKPEQEELVCSHSDASANPAISLQFDGIFESDPDRSSLGPCDDRNSTLLSASDRTATQPDRALSPIDNASSAGLSGCCVHLETSALSVDLMQQDQ
jgi:hypothetical protein